MAKWTGNSKPIKVSQHVTALAALDMNLGKSHKMLSL